MVMMLIIVVVFIVSLSIYDKATRFMVNPYDLVCYFGKKGSGKTSLISCLTYKYKKEGFHIYCTDKISGTNYINYKDIGSFVPLPNSVLFIDEIGLLFNNRDYKNFDKLKIEFFKLSRHYKCKIICFSQVYDDMDKTIRNLFDEIHLLTRFARIFQIDRKINTKYDIFNYKSGESESTSKGGAIIQVYKYSGLPTIRFLPRWIHCHDSYSTNESLSYLNSIELPLPCNIDNYYNGWKFYFAPTIRLFNRIKQWFIIQFNKLKGVFLADYD